MNVLSLFDGISCGQLALNRAGIEYNNYFASEIEKSAIVVTQHNFPNTIQLGDVKNINSHDLPKIDLMMGGSPCQGFSFNGKQMNFDDPRSKLFFEYIRLWNECKPTYWLLENVPMKIEYENVITNILGVKPITINSSLVSAQNRKRLYWTNIPTIQPDDRGIMLRDLVGDYDGIYMRRQNIIRPYGGKSPTLLASGWSSNFHLVRPDGSHDVCTIDVCEQLQTVPVGYTNMISNHKAAKALGNGWTVDVIAHIFRGIERPPIAPLDEFV